jgi:hypothetical protein
MNYQWLVKPGFSTKVRGPWYCMIDPEAMETSYELIGDKLGGCDPETRARLEQIRNDLLTAIEKTIIEPVTI